MNLDYIGRALCFHGQPMQKIWDNERGADDLRQLGIPAQPNYTIYQQRQRYFTFQDRAKRLKLHQFFARKANDLYDADLQKYSNVIDGKLLEKVKTQFATMPPYEMFAHDPSDKERKWHSVLESLKPGDIIYGIVGRCATTTYLPVKPLCTAEPLIRYLNHLPLKGFVLPQDCDEPLDENGKKRGYLQNDIVCCEILRLSTEVDRVFLSLKSVLNKDPNINLGLIKRENLPIYYNKAIECALQKYEKFLIIQKEFYNPNYEVLYTINGLDINDSFSMMSSLKRPFPQHEFAKELRKVQANKWAFRSVADGIELFKNGHHTEAFQCLNKALNIDPYNVEGLVARGALFANRGYFHKAVDDFGTALSLDKYHANARKYMGETLVALGRSLEDDKRFEEAAKAYKDCLELIPNHMQAQGCLEALSQRLTGSLLDDPFFNNFLNIPATNVPIPMNTAQQKLLQDHTKLIEISGEGSSTDSGSSSDSETSRNHSSIPKKEFSLSPLSKRMALHAANLRTETFAEDAIAMEAPPPPPTVHTTPALRFDQPFYSVITAQSATKAIVPDANEFKLDDDDDTQTRVLKLLKQASAHKKEKKKKTKKSKKSKKETKKSKTTNIIEDNGISNMKQSLFQTNYLLETFKNIGNDNFKQQLNKDINSYEQKIAKIQQQQEQLRQSLTFNSVTKDESPPPPPPPMKLTNIAENLTKIQFNINDKSNQARNYQIASTSSTGIASNSSISDANRFSFQIKKPLKVDKFGLVRIATPLMQRSRSRSFSGEREKLTPNYRRRQSRSRSHSSRRDDRRRSRSRSHSRSRRSSSPSSYRRHHRRSESNSRSPRRSRRDSPTRRRRRDSRSHSKHRENRKIFSERSISRLIRSPKRNKTNFGNRVWQRPGYKPPISASNERWLHDKFDEINSDKPLTVGTPKEDEGPSIEEIDEIINKAQKERKEEIIKRDKDILKKPNKGQF